MVIFLCVETGFFIMKSERMILREEKEMYTLKRIAAIISVGFMVISSSVFVSADSRELMDFTDNILEDGSLIYYFKEVSLTLPADWKDKIDIEVKDNTATFYHKSSREKWQETNGSDGGKLVTLSCSVNDDFSELPDFSYIGFSEESVMNYFLVFPTDVQAYTEDSTIAEEFQQLNSEIDFVKEHARMLGGEQEEAYTFEETQAEYEGTWVEMKGGFKAYLPSAWNEVELDEEDKKSGIDYVASSEDNSLIYIAISKDLSEDITEEDLQAELEEKNMTMHELLTEQLETHGYTWEKDVVINGIPCIYFTADTDTYGTVFMGQDGMTMEMMFLMGENLKGNPVAEAILQSAEWVNK